jgi:hypothetical protein
MVASPCPLVALRVIHGSFELADHAHSRSVFTARLPLPPEAGTSGGLLLIATAHFVSVGALTLVVADSAARGEQDCYEEWPELSRREMASSPHGRLHKSANRTVAN